LIVRLSSVQETDGWERQARTGDAQFVAMADFHQLVAIAADVLPPDVAIVANIPSRDPASILAGAVELFGAIQISALVDAK